MIELRRNVRFTRDMQEFVECFEQSIPFAAHVRDIFALVFRGDFAKLDQLFGLRVERRRVNERAANAERAGFHLLPDELAHFIHLLRRGLLVFEADNVLANRGRADKGGDVAGHTPFFEILQILDECVPRDVILDVRLLLQHVLADAIIHRAHRLAFAHDFSRDPLPNFTLGASILNKRFSRPGEHVYESWRDGEVVRVDHVRGR